jgi:hypothetical protein
VLESESLLLDLRPDQKIDGASGVLHSCMHCGEALGDTMEALGAPHADRSAKSSVDEFRLWTFGLKLKPGKHPWDLTWCIPFCLQNGTLITRVDKVRY